MIEARELRIGNIVVWANADGQKVGTKSRVSLICKDGVMVGENSEDERLSLTYDEISGIKLTEEILLKCGFEKRMNSYNKDYEYRKKGFVGSSQFIDEIGFVIFYNNEYPMRPMYHLHQLQNLYFALTGEELEVNL